MVSNNIIEINIITGFLYFKNLSFKPFGIIITTSPFYQSYSLATLTPINVIKIEATNEHIVIIGRIG